ncbi:hypothetical protein IX317_002121 [Fusobacterium sp. DD29]|uniref:baseplate assembly protein n=1 Tax=unclassified Fusobacterium TaxID=2648384 RepID=UPI001B8D5D7E|nr:MULTISPECIES: baseplate J/gp47 family protein [unclassified Fusobacterium]MBR8750399.1 hypothetical protein [Fusobacterium sp. DD29]MBR8762646.1 hypothetical protein [Fusobacterium sp. DD25]MBR8768670.1 hypothetical protein [Fusobacterium sp. DD43]MBR8772743.1 hypothetical protein [Fusobacterium sp. DD40]MBR8776952.1 hypothetical protein [Fusobacterium sp. DD17]
MSEIIDSNARFLKAKMMKKYEELSNLTLTKASPETHIFGAVAYLLAMREEEYNDAIKQNYLRFARKDRLDLLGEIYGDRGIRNKEQFAKATFRFHIISPKTKKIIIPKGSLIKHGTIYFATDEEYVIQVGQEYVEGVATCTKPGIEGNDIEIGAINTMVDLYPYFEKVENITISNGGTDIETDSNYRERLRLVPDSFTTAGSKKSYEFWTKSTSPKIIDVFVSSPSPCVVNIHALTGEGAASSELKKLIKNQLNDEFKRPLTDKVVLVDPEQINYDINLDYYIDKQKEVELAEIKEKIAKAIDKFIYDQRRVLGKDINPDDIVQILKNVGVKRCVITSPKFTIINRNQFAVCGSKNINYAGAEEE